MKFKLEMTEDDFRTPVNPHLDAPARVELDFEAENLQEVLGRIEQFLIGCGYYLGGHLIIDEDED